MIELLLSAEMILSCADGGWILDGIARTDLPNQARSELVIAVLEAMPDDCTEEDYVPGSR